MKVSELRSLPIAELEEKGKQLEQELFNIKFQLHTGRLENSAKINIVRKQIARVKTIISENQA